MTINVKKVLSELERHGFKKTRSNCGSDLFSNPTTGKLVTVPNHNNNLADSLVNEIKKQAGL